MGPTSNNGGPYKTGEEAQTCTGRRPGGDGGRGGGDAGRCPGPQELQEAGRPSLEPPEDARPCRPLDFGLQPPGPGESRVPLLQVPSLRAFVTAAPGRWSRGVSGAPRVCPAACGCLALGQGEAGGAPVSCRGSHSGLLLPRLSLSPSHVLRRGLHPSWGPEHAVCLPGGRGGGSGLPPGSPSPWWCWGWGMPPSETRSQGLDSSIS